MNEVVDERDLKRTRRRQKNRESAQRSRQRKANETLALANAVRVRDAELAEWRVVCSTLQNNLRKVALQVSSLGGHVDPALLCVQLPGTAKGSVHGVGSLAAATAPAASTSPVRAEAAAASSVTLSSSTPEAGLSDVGAQQALIAAIAVALSSAQH
jgi:hypothetical protein